MKVRIRRRELQDKLATPPRGITHLASPSGKAAAAFPISTLEILGMDRQQLQAHATMAQELSRAYFLELQRRAHESNSPLHDADARSRDYCLKRVQEFLKEGSRK